MSVTIGIACEDNGHFATVTRIVDELAISHHDWLDGILDDCRQWVGICDGTSWYKYDPDDAKHLEPLKINGKTVRNHGHIGGKPLEPEARMWRALLSLFFRRDPRPDVVILVRDMDGYLRRREGAVQVRDGITWPFEVVIAAPQPEIEAWWVSGFVPADDVERRRLDELRQRLSFNPTTESHRLTSHPNDASTDAKRILHFLCGTDDERPSACLKDHTILRERGRFNGLEAFLSEAEQRIPPVFRAKK